MKKILSRVSNIQSQSTIVFRGAILWASIKLIQTSKLLEATKRDKNCISTWYRTRKCAKYHIIGILCFHSNLDNQSILDTVCLTLPCKSIIAASRDRSQFYSTEILKCIPKVKFQTSLKSLTSVTKKKLKKGVIEQTREKASICRFILFWWKALIFSVRAVRMRTILSKSQRRNQTKRKIKKPKMMKMRMLTCKLMRLYHRQSLRKVKILVSVQCHPHH